MSSEGATFGRYRAEIRLVPPLTPVTERELAVRCRAGDRLAARRLVEGSLAVVVAIAHEYRRCRLPLQDIVQEGNVGLMKAVEHFDPDRGARLSSYAAYWIRAEIRAYVARHYRVVRIGWTKGEERALWFYRKTREHRPAELAAASGLTIERATALLPLLQANDVSLSPLPARVDQPSLTDRLADPAGTAEDALGEMEERSRLHADVAGVLEGLPVREQDIVRRRLMAEEPVTLGVLGATWGVSKERVRQLEASVKKELEARLAPAESPAWADPRRDRGAHAASNRLRSSPRPRR